MSHFVDVKTKITNPRALVAALKRMGFNTVEVHKTAQQLKDYRGLALDLGGLKRNAEIIIRKRFVDPYSNDLGFTRKQDGTYEAILDSGWLNKQKNWMGRLTAYYGVEHAKLECTRHRYQYMEDEYKGLPRLKVLIPE